MHSPQPPLPAIIDALLFAGRSFGLMQRQRFAQWQVLLGSLMVWMQVAVLPLLLFIPLPILRLLEPGYPAKDVLQWMVFALICLQTLLRPVALTGPQRMGLMMLWPHWSSRLAIELTPMLLSQWVCWLWTLSGVVIAVGFMRGELAWWMLNQWLLLLIVFSILSFRYCGFVGCLLLLPWLCQQGVDWLLGAIVLEWGLWQFLQFSWAHFSVNVWLQYYSQRSVVFGFLLRIWRGKSLVWPLLALVIGIQVEANSRVFYWSMAVAMSFACLQALLQWQDFLRSVSYATQLMGWRGHWWLVATSCLVAPWLWLMHLTTSWSLAIALFGAAALPSRFALSWFVIITSALSLYLLV